MKIIRITGAVGLGKTAVLRSYQRQQLGNFNFLDLTGWPAEEVELELIKFHIGVSPRPLVTVIVDDCSAAVEKVIENTDCRNAVAVIVCEAAP